MNRGASWIIAGAFIGLAGTLALSDPHFFAAKASATSAETFSKLNLFGDVFERVRSDYVEKPDDKRMPRALLNLAGRALPVDDAMRLSVGSQVSGWSRAWPDAQSAQL
jgi:hypothetical protein